MMHRPQSASGFLRRRILRTLIVLIALAGCTDRSPDPGAKPIRVLTFNVLGCRGFPLTTGGPVVFPEVSPALCAALADRLTLWQVDVALIQEAPPEPFMRDIARLAGMQVAFFSAQIQAGPDYPFGFPGAILARQPLSRIQERASAVRSGNDPRFQRHWGSATVTITGHELSTTCTHLCADWGGVNREATRLAELDAVLAVPGMDVIGADCNAKPESALWRRLRAAGWRDGWIESGSNGAGFTSDCRHPHQRIDYLWLAPQTPWRVRSAHVQTDLRLTVDGVDLWLSDHFPVLTELEYAPTP